MINFHPKKGTILSCNFSPGFEPPEMVKVRPVIILTPELRGRSGLCTIVPLSTKEPRVIQSFHFKINPNSLPKKLQKQTCWAKCDMIYTVRFERLDRIRDKDENGKRIYVTGRVSDNEMTAIEASVLHGLGLSKYL